MTNIDKCFFCNREMDPHLGQILFNPAHTPETKPTVRDFEKLKNCCMGCKGKIKDFMIERETKQAANKDGKLLFCIDDGESHWYLGDSEDQVMDFHERLDDEIIIDQCRPVSILEALKLTVQPDEYNENGKEVNVVMYDFINEGNWYYDNGVVMVSSTAY